MSDNDIFSNTISSADPLITPNAVPNGLSENPELSELIGTDKKYSNINEAMNGIPHAQKHISTLEQENLDLRAEVQKRMTAEEILKQVQASKEGDETHQPNLDKETIANLVSDTINSMEVSKARDANRDIVNSKMETIYGTSEAAAVAFKQRAKELNLSSESLLSTAQQSPSAFYALMGIDANTNKGEHNLSGDVSQSMINQGNSNAPKLHTHAWYQSLRKEVGNDKYYSDKIQKQMHAHSQQMGRDFFN